MTAHPASTPEHDGHARKLLERALHESDHAAAARLREHVLEDTQEMATEAAKRFEGQGVDRNDLDQVAMLALDRAIRQYEPGQGSFSASAASLITADLTRYVREHGQLMPSLRRGDESDRDVHAVARELRQYLKREPNLTEIARVMGLTCEDVRSARAVADEEDDSYDTSVTLVSLCSTLGRDSRGREIRAPRTPSFVVTIRDRLKSGPLQVLRLLLTRFRRLRG